MNSEEISKNFSIVPMGESPHGHVISFNSCRKSIDHSEWSLGGFLVDDVLGTETFLNVCLDGGQKATLVIDGLSIDDVLMLSKLLGLSSEVDNGQ